MRRRTGMSATATVTGLALAAVMVSGPAASGQTMPSRSATDAPMIYFDLADALRNAPANERLPIVIIMRDQASREEIARIGQLRDKAAQRQQVIALLKGVAEPAQANLLGELRAAEANGGVSDLRPLWIHNVIGAKATPAVIRRVAARADVAEVHYDRPMRAEDLFPVIRPDVPDEIKAGTRQGGGVDAVECGVDLMDADRVWSEFNITGRNVVVGIIDTGACITHPDIRNQIWINQGEIPNNNIDDDGNGFIDDINGWNFESRNNNVSDQNGHGTHTTGTVSGDGTNGTTTGMAPDCQMMILKFFNSFSGEQTVWDSMQYGLDNGADVLTASLGWPHSFNPIRATWRAICENCIAGGIVVTYAAGNEGNCCGPVDNVRTPGDVPDVLTVGATDCSDNLASFSSIGPVTWQSIPPYNDWPYPPGKIKPTVAAPGVNTVSTSNNCSSYTTLSGTSMATPHIAGAAALVLEADPNLSPGEVVEILRATAVDLGVPGDDNQYGAGRVDAYEAVAAAFSGGPPFRLTVNAQCPGGGPITVSWTSATPDVDVGLIYAHALGSFVIPNAYPCPGTVLGLSSNGIQVVFVTNSGANGSRTVNGTVRSANCSGQLQMIDLSNCETSNTAQIL